MLRRMRVFLLILVLPSVAIAQEAATRPGHSESLTDAAIAAAIIAASIGAYKAMGRPCACPEDTMKNGARCGNRSAYAKPGGAKPLCYTTDITADMISVFRKTRTIPNLR